jgi:DNA polymerase-3 subunit alpha
LAKIKSVKEVGMMDTYDLEVEHPDHQYYLSNGMLTSNSHSVSYSHISYYTAWLRCHYPTQFMCALLNSEDPNSDKTLEYISECSKMGISITPPDVNKSTGSYVTKEDGTIVTGLTAIKGVGDTAIQEIISLQPFASIEDFFFRTNARVVNKRVMESMSKAGAFTSFGRTRKDIFENHSHYRDLINKEKKKGKTIDDIVFPTYHEEWERKDLLTNEREVLGRTISGSLHEVFKGFFRQDSNVTPLRKIPQIPSGTKVKIEVIIKAMVKEFKIKRGKNIGRKFAKYLVEDAEGSTAELTVWQDDYDKYMTVLTDGLPIRAICKVDEYMEQKGLSLSLLESALGKKV